MREKRLSFSLRFYFSITFDTLATVAGKVLMVVGRSCRCRQYVAPTVGEGGGCAPIVGMSAKVFFFYKYILINFKLWWYGCGLVVVVG